MELERFRQGERQGYVRTVREFTSSTALAKELRTMHHFAPSYTYRHVKHHTVIFSLGSAGAQRVTIELDPFGHSLVRGVCNRDVTSEEQSVTECWLLTAANPRID